MFHSADISKCVTESCGITCPSERWNLWEDSKRVHLYVISFHRMDLNVDRPHAAA